MKININQLLDLSNYKELIRNVGIISHVDHGKSTLSDVILSEAGYIAHSLAGKLLYLDFLEEERKRGITIKTSAISLLMKTGSRNYILNLVDTPGHVDFSGKVTRALRIIDGSIVVVDAVEGIMSQTEYVVREAIREGVKTILYINKLDRLIRELNFSENQILARLEEIVMTFNQLVDRFAKKNSNYFKVDVNRETVFFGSALYKWGFTVKSALEKNLKMRDIIKMVKDDPSLPEKIIPLGRLVSRLIYEKLPSPKEAQILRTPILWTGSEPPSSVLNCSDEDPTVIYVSKITRAKNGILCTARVFSGTVKKSQLIDLVTGKTVKILSVGVPLGSNYKVVNSMKAGNIVALLVNSVDAGTTLSDKKINGHFLKPTYTISPVIYVALTPINPREFDKLIDLLDSATLEDPNLRYEIQKDTGQILLWGVGELQLELTVKQLRERINLYSSEPLVAYKEALINGSDITRDNVIVKIKPLSKIGDDGSVNVDNKIMISGLSEEEKIKIEPVVRTYLLNGPIVGEPLINVELTIKTVKKGTSAETIIDALTEAFSHIETRIAEPYYKFEIITKPEYIGSVSNEITRRKGTVEKVQGEEGGSVSIVGKIPVRTSLKLSSTLRELTHGNAYIQLRFHSYIIVGESEMESLISEIRARKGL